MISKIGEVMQSNGDKCLDILQCTEVYFSEESKCIRITLNDVTIENNLSSNQEEADTKVALHSKHAYERSPEKVVIVRSPSGDIDIIVIMLGMFIDQPDHFFIDSGSGKNRKGFLLNEINLNDDIKNCLIGFHAFTGNDYISSFYRNGKAVCWKVLENNPKFLKAFQDLGTSWELTDETFELLEEYVCKLYGCREDNVDQVRFQLFQKKLKRENKIIDLSLLPPCKSVLLLHTKRANCVAKIWRCSNEAQLQVPDFKMHGWDANCKIKWLEKEFPDNIQDLFFDSNFDETDTDIMGRDEETDEEESI